MEFIIKEMSIHFIKVFIKTSNKKSKMEKNFLNTRRNRM